MSSNLEFTFRPMMDSPVDSNLLITLKPVTAIDSSISEIDVKLDGKTYTITAFLGNEKLAYSEKEFYSLGKKVQKGYHNVTQKMNIPNFIPPKQFEIEMKRDRPSDPSEESDIPQNENPWKFTDFSIPLDGLTDQEKAIKQVAIQCFKSSFSAISMTDLSLNYQKASSHSHKGSHLSDVSDKEINAVELTKFRIKDAGGEGHCLIYSLFDQFEQSYNDHLANGQNALHFKKRQKEKAAWVLRSVVAELTRQLLQTENQDLLMGHIEVALKNHFKHNQTRSDLKQLCEKWNRSPQENQSLVDYYCARITRKRPTEYLDSAFIYALLRKKDTLLPATSKLIEGDPILPLYFGSLPENILILQKDSTLISLMHADHAQQATRENTAVIYYESDHYQSIDRKVNFESALALAEERRKNSRSHKSNS